MTRITPKQIRDFIASQPNDACVDMNQSHVEDDTQCGCLMIQLARHLGASGPLRAGCVTISTGDNWIYNLPAPIHTFVPSLTSTFTYAELKKFNHLPS